MARPSVSPESCWSLPYCGQIRGFSQCFALNNKSVSDKVLKDLKPIFVVLLAVGVLLQTHSGHTASLKSIQYRPQSTSAKSSETPVIIRFKDGINIDGIRRKVARAVQGRGLDRKQLRLSRRQMLRSGIVSSLKKSNASPVALISDYLAQKGLAREIRPLWGINAIAATLPTHLIAEISAMQEVDRISYDEKLMMANPPSSPPSGLPLWNLEDINAPELWSKGITGQGVVVGVMDSGADLSHPDLVERWRGGENSWFDPYAQHADPVDLNGHGTQTTGLMVGGDASGYQVGVAPGAQWIAAKIFNDANQVTLSAIHEAFQWMLDPDNDSSTDDAPDVVNNSWGFGDRINECFQEFSEDIRLLKEAGIAVVFSAGNYGPASESSISPANDPAVLSVGSVDQFHEIETTSSRGPGSCDGGIFPRLVAPGRNIYTTDLTPMDYNLVSGTSFASPHVAGAMALLMSSFPSATVSQVETALIESATDLGSVGADHDSGYGLLDIAAAYDWMANLNGVSNAGILMFSEDSYSIDETTPALTVTVNRIGGSQGEIAVDYETYDGVALADVGGDYISTFGTLVFLDGETSRSFEVSISDDEEDELDETFNLRLSNPQGGAILANNRDQSSVVIHDDDGAGSFSFESASYIVREDRDQIELTVYRSGGRDGLVDVEYATADDTAIGSIDYVSADGTLRFGDGESRGTISIDLIDNDVHEENKVFYIMLTSASNGGDLSEIVSAKITLIDNDLPITDSTIVMESVSRSVDEDTGVVEITISRKGENNDPTIVEYTTVSSSAKEGKDYIGRSGKVSFPGGANEQTLTITVEIVDDVLNERDEVFSVSLIDATNGATIGNPSSTLIRILDNDTALPTTTALMSSGVSINNNASGSGKGSGGRGGSGSPTISLINNGSRAAGRLSVAGIVGVEVVNAEMDQDSSKLISQNDASWDLLPCAGDALLDEGPTSPGVEDSSLCNDSQDSVEISQGYIETDDYSESMISDPVKETGSPSVITPANEHDEQSVIDRIMQQIEEVVNVVRDYIIPDSTSDTIPE